MNTLPIIIEDAEPVSETLDGSILSPEERIKNIDADKIRASISDLSEKISQILGDIKSVGDFKLKQVQLGVEISAEGGVALIGTAKAGAKGAITLTFEV